MAKKDEITDQIDFSVLGNMELPPIEGEQVKEVKPVTKKEQEGIKENLISEVDSIEDFSKEEKVQTEEKPEEETLLDETQIPEETLQEETEISVIKGLAEWGKEKGIIEYDPEKFEDSEEWLQNAFNDKIQREVQAEVTKYKEEIPGVIKDIINNYEDGVPLDELVYSKSREIEYNRITASQIEESEEIQKKLVSDWLANQDFEPEEIEAKIKKLQDAVLLEDEAKTAHKKLKVFESRYQQQLAQAAEENRKAQERSFQEQLKALENEVMSAKEIIPGIPLTDDQKRKIFEAYTKPDSKKETALMRTIKADPKSWLKVTQFLVLMNGNLEEVKKTLGTQSVKKIKETVTSYQEPGSSLSKININKIKKALEIQKRQKT